MTAPLYTADIGSPSSPKTYPPNATIRFTVTFLDDQDTPVDPTTILFLARRLNHSVSTYTYADDEVKRSSTGVYYFDFSPTYTGEWRAAWESNLASSLDIPFRVMQSALIGA